MHLDGRAVAVRLDQTVLDRFDLAGHFEFGKEATAPNSPFGFAVAAPQAPDCCSNLRSSPARPSSSQMALPCGFDHTTHMESPSSIPRRANIYIPCFAAEGSESLLKSAVPLREQIRFDVVEVLVLLALERLAALPTLLSPQVNLAVHYFPAWRFNDLER
jgi:hypothetical protein